MLNDWNISHSTEIKMQKSTSTGKYLSCILNTEIMQSRFYVEQETI